jgi:ADP-heptose:LPS heptosyltransferase/predicted SAM-dependent methyltransferase
MTWNKDAPYKAESKKIVWEVAPYLRGRGIDIGAGSFKVLPHAISVDNCVDTQMFGIQMMTDIKVQTAEDLSIFGTRSMDFVYSSHLLEHLDKPECALKEWWRVLKVGGYMVLYLPHQDLYPKVGEPGANHDHKHNLDEAIVIDWLRALGGWDIEVCDKRDNDDEYSLLLVVKKRDDKRQLYSHLRAKPEKTACVVRYGAFGDMMMASSVWAGLKKQGYHITVFAALPGSDAISHDPNIDKLVLFDKDQVPNGDLGAFWAWQRKKYDKFVNLSESVEGALLSIPDRSPYEWPPAARHEYMNRNYVEFSHKIAGVPHVPDIHFFATDDEKAWAKKTRSKMGGFVIMWSLSGSSVHKTWAGLDRIIASVLVNYPDTTIVLVGGPEGQILEAGWENEPRVVRTCGKWSIRQSLSFIAQSDLVIGPETGVLNAACCEEVSKIIFLSHSTSENLTRDWKNTISINSAHTVCPGRGNNEAPACHQLHYGWGRCKLDAASGTAQCQVDIPVGEVWDHVDWVIQAVAEQKRKAA